MQKIELATHELRKEIFEIEPATIGNGAEGSAT